MEYIKQFLIILAISFIGEICRFILPFPIPGSIYGMILLFLLLIKGRVKISQINDVSKFLLNIMPILFIPSAVGIMTKVEDFINIWWQIIIITIVTTVIVMVVSGLVTQRIIRKSKEKKKNEKQSSLESGNY